MRRSPFLLPEERRDIMQEKKTSAFSGGLIWFGAAVSIAEILTGTLLSSLGFCERNCGDPSRSRDWLRLAVFGRPDRRQNPEKRHGNVKLSFGQKGSLLFSALNVLQLTGWTAVMIYSGAAAARFVVSIGGDWVWSIVIGALIIVWILIG
jgi:purine-cytosine permease-like protein